MLPALAILAVTLPPFDALPAFTSPEGVITLLSPLGYDLKLAGKGRPDGTLTHEGTTAWVGLAMTTGDPAKGTRTTYPFMGIRIELAVPGTANASPPPAQPYGGEPVSFVFHFGGTATETAQIDLRKGATRTSIRRALDEFWAKGRAFAKAHGVAYANAPEFDPKRTRLGDALTLDAADRESLRRAALGWGWSHPEDAGYTSQGWMLPIRVSGRTFYLRQTVLGTDAQPRSIDIARYGDKPTDGDPWASRAEGDPMPSVVYAPDGMHLASLSETLDLAKGMTLGELRRRIEAFAARSDAD